MRIPTLAFVFVFVKANCSAPECTSQDDDEAGLLQLAKSSQRASGTEPSPTGSSSRLFQARPSPSTPPGLGPAYRLSGAGGLPEKIPASEKVARPSPAKGGGSVTYTGTIDRVDFDPDDTNAVFITIKDSPSRARITWYRKDVVRVQFSWSGEFDDPGAKINVVKTGGKMTDTTWKLTQEEDKWVFQAYDGTAEGTEGLIIYAYKDPLKFELRDAAGMLFQELTPLAMGGGETTQHLHLQQEERIYGAGMYLGSYDHTNQDLDIRASWDWEPGTNPNAVPFLMSSKGYGIYRSTFAWGRYQLAEGTLMHEEEGYDAFWFAPTSRDLKAVLEGYTWITGRPFMPPVYALGLGDSDCYHNSRHGFDTETAVSVAKLYKDFDMPISWMIINDGYGCGYGTGPEDFPEDLDVLEHVSGRLEEEGIITGLWYANTADQLASEVDTGRVRVVKTDVAWLGEGGEMAFDAVTKVATDIEGNSDARRFIWTIEGWAGTHRNAVMWTGDNYGEWDYIKWQIPSFIGSGLSGQAHVSGDIDGIFSGSAESSVRDLQWKCFTTVMMIISSWSYANPDKQPYAWGEPYATINRYYLRLKIQLTPYLYTLSRQAYETGVPPIRAMFLERPDDPKLWHLSGTDAIYQFFAGPFFLVAPVYRPLSETTQRQGIYLPSGWWIDYWTGAVVQGGGEVERNITLEHIPVYVKAGAIIPMWPQMSMIDEREKSPLTLDIYPHGNSNFELYEDDGVTRSFEKGEYSKTMISVTAPSDMLELGGKMQVSSGGRSYSVHVGPSGGHYRGKLYERTYNLVLHVPWEATKVKVERQGATAVMERVGSKALLKSRWNGWFFDRTYMFRGRPYSWYTWEYNKTYFRMPPNRGCEQEPEACPPWHMQALTVKVQADPRQGFRVFVES